MKKARNELRDLNVIVDSEISAEKLDARAQRFNTVSILKRETIAEGKEPKTEKQRDDEHLIKSSANDLEDAVRVYSSGDSSDDDYGTMVADRIERNLKTTRHEPTKGELRITASNTSVKSRLGKRPPPNSILKEDDKTMVSDSIDLHPTDLRNRLGKKRPTASSFFNTDHSGSKRRRHRSDEEEGEYELETAANYARSNRGNREGREQERYAADDRRHKPSSKNRQKSSSRHHRREHRSPVRNPRDKYEDEDRRTGSDRSRMKSSVSKSAKSPRPSRDEQVENSNGRTLVRYSPSPFDD